MATFTIDDTIASTLTMGVVSGMISTVACSCVREICHYFSREERFKRQRLVACRKAIYELSERFKIDVGHSALFELTPTVSTETYIYCLFETYLILNGTTGREKYPEDSLFKSTATRWYNEWNTARMADSIEFMSPSEINRLVIEVNSYGINGCPWTERLLPTMMKFVHNVKGYLSRRRNKYDQMCDFLYREYKLPYNNNLTKINLEMLERGNK